MKTKLNALDDYLQAEVLKIRDGYSKNKSIEILSEISGEKKKALVEIIEEIKRFNCSNPLTWAIQDIDESEDFGGSAYFMFVKGIIDIYKNPKLILDDFDDEKFIDFLEIAKIHLKEDFDYFFQSFAFNLAIRLIDHISKGNTQTDILRSWKLCSVKQNERPNNEILDLNLFREMDDFDY